MVSFYLFIILNTLLFKHAYGYLDINNLTYNNAFDLQLYEDVLDPMLCQEQLDYLRRNNTLLLATFMDAGIRVPKGILMGNTLDMGNYYQCLRIKDQIPGSVVEGKYCSINVPLDFFPSLPMAVDSSEFLWRDAVPNKFTMSKDTLHRLQMFQQLKEGFDIKHKVISRSTSDNPLQGLNFNLAICLPKVCTTREAINGLFNTTAIDLSFEDNFCRLPDDKPLVLADYFAIVIFSLIGILTILSTGYDVYYSVLRQTDPRAMNKMCLAFSVYTNTRRLVTYDSVPGTLECLDGIRVISMIWVIVGHTFSFQMNDLLANPSETMEWTMSWQSLWITAAPISVDTFFTLSGLLVVYTTAGKLTGMKLLKNLHLFYLNRLLRMFPILAAFVLAQASFINRVADGPDWSMVVGHTHRCRVYWWSTLLYIQNFFNSEQMQFAVSNGHQNWRICFLNKDNFVHFVCIAHTWYLAVDMQLYVISPIVLFWVLTGRKRYAWTALLLALSCAMLSSSIYNIINEFPSGPLIPTRLEEHNNYMMRYYIHTLTRSPPFFVGMVYGYLLHLYRNKKCTLPMLHVTALWVCAIGIMSTVLYSRYPIVQMDWDNQTADTLINCLKRPSWALALGWVIFACVCGYGGPINWFLSLRMWKVPSRLSYAMYIVHYPLMYAVIASTISPNYFSVPFSIMKSLHDVALAVIVAFLVVVLIDAPCTVLIKQFMGPGPRKPQKQSLTNDLPKTQPTIGSVNNAYIK